MPSVLITVVAAVALLIGAGAANAVTLTWDGGSGNWTDAHWSGGGSPPAAGDQALIDGAPGTLSVVTLDTNATVDGVTVDGGDELIVDQTRVLFVGAPGVTPALANGRPVKVWVRQQYRFALH